MVRMVKMLGMYFFPGDWCPAIPEVLLHGPDDGLRGSEGTLRGGRVERGWWSRRSYSTRRSPSSFFPEVLVRCQPAEVKKNVPSMDSVVEMEVPRSGGAEVGQHGRDGGTERGYGS